MKMTLSFFDSRTSGPNVGLGRTSAWQLNLDLAGKRNGGALPRRRYADTWKSRKARLDRWWKPNESPAKQPKLWPGPCL
jgi:hypothetical protein